jgi:hypothetical protein
MNLQFMFFRNGFKSAKWVIFSSPMGGSTGGGRPAIPPVAIGGLLRMYVEEIILEGFKSYATRTVISGWDPEFNAITGLNGTGKSNILDAICFVLGIDNLRQVQF